MSHKIYKVKMNSDYLVDITFFNGEIRQCDLKVLVESEALTEDKDLAIEKYMQLEIEKSRNGIVLPGGHKIDSETLWGNAYAVRQESITDPVIAFADELINLREGLNMSQRDLEIKSGVRQAEISKIERGDGNPSLKTMGKLFAAMGRTLNFGNRIGLGETMGERYPLVSESVVKYLKPQKMQGTYKVADLEHIPEDVFVELIDGVIYDMCVPSIPHQLIVKNLVKAFDRYIESNGGECITFSGQTGVWFDDDNMDLLIPDMFVVCDRNKVKHKGVVGSPDFVLEVLSPSGRSRDLSLKLRKYQDNGVNEYWIIDPDNRKVIVYDWKHTDIPQIFGIDTKIPVGIYDGKLVVDMAIVFDGIKFDYDE